MKKPESKFWHLLRDGTRGKVHWTRVESWSVPGVPDLNGCMNGKEFWVELKVLTTKTDKKFPKWRPHQIAWQTGRTAKGGCVWNLVHHLLSRRLFIIDGKNLGPRLMDDDCTYDGTYEMPKDYDGWSKILERMIS